MEEGQSKDSYKENGFTVFTSSYHLKRGYCCGSGCRHCPYEPKAVKGNKIVNIENKEDDKRS